MARPSTAPLKDLQMKYKKFSGLEPDLYLEFVTNLDLVPKDPVFLGRAIDALRRLSMYAPNSDEFDLDEVGRVGEDYIVRSRTRGLFFPRYLNDTI